MERSIDEILDEVFALVFGKGLVMAINLKTLSKPEGQRPIICYPFFGEGGMGKTTLASMFPLVLLYFHNEQKTVQPHWWAMNDVQFPVSTAQNQSGRSRSTIRGFGNWRSTIP